MKGKYLLQNYNYDELIDAYNSWNTEALSLLEEKYYPKTKKEIIATIICDVELNGKIMVYFIIKILFRNI